MEIKPLRKDVENYLDNLIMDIYCSNDRLSLDKLGNAITFLKDKGYPINDYYKDIYQELNETFKYIKN